MTPYIYSLLSRVPKDVTGKTDTERAIDRAFEAEIHNSKIDDSIPQQIVNIVENATILPYEIVKTYVTRDASGLKEIISHRKIDSNGNMVPAGALEAASGSFFLMVSIIINIVLMVKLSQCKKNKI